VRWVSSARMRTSTYRATSRRSAASGLSDYESQGSRAGSHFNFTKTLYLFLGFTALSRTPIAASARTLTGDAAPSHAFHQPSVSTSTLHDQGQGAAPAEVRRRLRRPTVVFGRYPWALATSRRHRPMALDAPAMVGASDIDSHSAAWATLAAGRGRAISSSQLSASMNWAQRR
jgi:hypothetical protein